LSDARPQEGASGKGGSMPFVNIQILKGHSQQRKDEMSRRITAAIREVAELPPNAQVWVVWDEVTDENWFVDGVTAKAMLGR
jgi:4-oxalocrotonate tautomerase